MRNSRLSPVRQTTSSRQSPRMSAQRTGVALEPLFEVHPSAVSSRVSLSLSQFHLEIWLRSSSSRSRSPSHQTPKLQERGLRCETVSPRALHTPLSLSPDAQHSYPACRGSMSIVTPRPTSRDGLLHRRAPVRASCSSAPCSCRGRSWILKISSPGRWGSMSDRCSASPCPQPVL